MLVCERGHKISGNAFKARANNCPQCGAEAYKVCPSCSEFIPGDSQDDMGYYPSGDPPNNCHKCGTAFPWSISRLASQETSSSSNSDDEFEEVAFDGFHIDGGNAAGEGGFAKLYQTKRKPTNKKVFVVHGHDAGMRLDIADVLTALGLEPIILSDQPGQSRTIIEKFEHHADVDFAVALLSPDDVGRAKDSKPKDGKPRARQNVILELGYFVGSLGRQKVCALKKGNVEVPSDFVGVEYIDFDVAGGWKLRLVKELKAAGYEVDAGKLA
jgi:hypothetical protein